ncbi:rhodanese-like domain-containing protein [Paenibacillus sp. JSM ZJ436]|uniref:rhodanese-like domain-containing protein n=1 Tax=Paenibacillus sp. JSM ZJ436 TaxID=3376190 RepID=UPI00378EFC8F
MFWQAFLLLGLVLFLLQHRLGPVKGLRFLGEEQLLHIKESRQIQILDIRDASDFEKGHLPGAINIYIGRLPYVSMNELVPGEQLVIVSSSAYHIRKAARILKKSGYPELAAFVCREHDAGRSQEQRRAGMGACIS